MSKLDTSSEQPILTVATVCFNVVKGGRVASFHNCISSVRSQTLGSIEHLIVDGGSKDGTRELVRDCGPNDNCRVISEPDRGIYDAMNKAIRLARGKYICFLNTDDAFTDAGAAGAVVEAMQRENADYSIANADVYSENHATLLRTWCSSVDDIPFGYYPCHQTVFCKASVLREIGGFTEKYLANDNLLMLKLVVRGYSCVYVNRSVVDFHVGGASGDMIADRERMRKEHIEFFLEEFGKKVGLSELDCAWLYERGFQGMSHEDALSLGSRLGLPQWIKRYYSLLIQSRTSQAAQSIAPSTRQVRVRVLGKFPLFGVDIPR